MMTFLRSFLVVLLAASAAACATSGAVPRPFPGAAIPPGVDAGDLATGEAAGRAVVPPAGAGVVAAALALRGTPYRNGGSDPSGFDCSGFVQYVFAHAGTRLPREVREQYLQGVEIDRPEARAGDLVFFETVSRGPSHVGLLVDGDQFVHAPSSRGVVRVERLSSAYWSRRIVGLRRIDVPSPAVATR
jgi:cell wall-associated NlpC family hydrolase